jgi:hypothetical protein
MVLEHITKMTSDMDRQNPCEGEFSGPSSEEPGCFSNPPQNITESSAITKEIGKLSEKIEMLEDDSRTIKDELVVRALGAISDKVNVLEKKIEEYCSRLKSLEDDIDEIVDKKTVIELINDMVPAVHSCK